MQKCKTIELIFGKQKIPGIEVNLLRLATLKFLLSEPFEIEKQSHMFVRVFSLTQLNSDNFDINFCDKF